jgi:hypothetical protein
MTFTRADLKRVAWTAIQAGLATFLTLAPGFWKAPNMATAKALAVAVAVAALAAGFSALKNLLLADSSTIK